ncbi:uncharacterized protein MONBRDRAFT_7903 [Monosiga brevicollis MX1]|uniref:SURP motif domain-containing protein n=1 Tax=Monosiga brevicollis TaxID=81824 RepID=A9UYF2_MONBE|nr:uncharacterized protein MONBRDRAFT_7903 [Monosiga brevicollis MX1]EDQ89452.1 predicted protein [Monosiga brevicollis MX1]|eukprot:XP_001745481.1 hypothetical protein [Monosiga brevicollis MX1]
MMVPRTSGHGPASTGGEEDELLVFGYGSTLFEATPRVVQSINEGHSLIGWLDRDDVTLDRYDARLLVDDYQVIRKQKRPNSCDSRLLCFISNTTQTDAQRKASPNQRLAFMIAEQPTLHKRHHDTNRDASGNARNRSQGVRGQSRQTRIDLQGRPSTRPQAGNGVGAAIAPPEQLRQADANTASLAKDSSTPAEEPSKVEDLDLAAPPEDLALPECVAHLAAPARPHTQRQLEVIERTTKFLLNNPPQMEIVMRSKQSRNPWMQFLNMKHRLYNFYVTLKLHLKDAPEETKETTTTTPASGETTAAAAAEVKPATASTDASRSNPPSKRPRRWDQRPDSA